MLEGYVPLYGAIKADTAADIVVVARCVSSKQFAQQRHGDWNHFWYVVTFEVLTVEKAKWDHPNLSFVCMDAWPTPESGIMVNKAPWPYPVGVRMRFWLDGTKIPARVLGQERLPSGTATRSTTRP
jgi:hypothetical protein